MNPQGPWEGPKDTHSWLGPLLEKVAPAAPAPHTLVTALPGVPVGPGMETLRGDFQAQRDQVPGPCCPQRGIWSLGEGHTICRRPWI